MNKDITDLRRFIKETETGLANAKDRLARIEHQCRHTWGEMIKIQIPRIEFRNGEMITRGSDFWHESIPYTVYDTGWERTCSACGKKETTKRSEDVVTKKPVF